MSSAYNQMLLDKQSRRLTQFVIGSQQYELNRLLYGISIRLAAFSAFTSKIFWQLILRKNVITILFRRFFYAIINKNEMFIVLDKYHQILVKENIKPASGKSHFFVTRVKFLGHIIEGNTIISLKSFIDAIIKKFNLHQIKRKSQNFLECKTF